MRRFSKLLDRDLIVDGEFLNEFLDTVMEAPIESVPEFASLVPERLRVEICKYLDEFAELDYFDTGHMFDKRSPEHKRAMHDHYERATEILLTLLGCSRTALV